MLLSLGVMTLCGLAFGGIFKKCRLPGLLGFLLMGILIGPYGLDWISPEILGISGELRQIALVVILTRAGLALKGADLKKIGMPAIRMCFLPATLEILATTLVAPLLFPITRLEAAILGTVLGAVSPAVVVPQMLRLMETGYGRKKGVPQLIMAGASVDDIYVIVLFTSFMGMYSGNGFTAAGLLKIPVAIVTGLVAGIAVGALLNRLLYRLSAPDTVKAMILLCCGFLLVSLETAVKAYVPLSGLLAVMALGLSLRKGSPPLADRMSGQLSKVWIPAELMLFMLVGATVDIGYAAKAGLATLLLLLAALLARGVGVWLCLVKTQFSFRERVFCVIAYLPKATVQAAIGGLPLAAGVGAGSLILTVAAFSILLTAPLGAVGMEATYKRLLTKEEAG